MSKPVDISAKIKQIEMEVKGKLAGGQLKVVPKPQSVIAPPSISAKNKLPIRRDDIGAKIVYCPQSDFGMDTQFCVGCRSWKGEKMGIVYCDYSAEEPALGEDEV